MLSTFEKNMLSHCDNYIFLKILPKPADHGDCHNNAVLSSGISTLFQVKNLYKQKILDFLRCMLAGWLAAWQTGWLADCNIDKTRPAASTTRTRTTSTTQTKLALASIKRLQNSR